ncbi:MAG: phosphopantetheine-binding protein [Clostridia bacterium]|nr:phosphopantetheine-binding protein [Clostridia bacterium]
MKEQIIGILEQVKGGINYAAEEKLIDDKLLDSFDVISLISELADTFDVEIGIDDMLPENFNSVDAICALVERLQEDA